MMTLTTTSSYETALLLSNLSPKPFFYSGGPGEVRCIWEGEDIPVKAAFIIAMKIFSNVPITPKMKSSAVDEKFTLNELSRCYRKINGRVMGNKPLYQKWLDAPQKVFGLFMTGEEW